LYFFNQTNSTSWRNQTWFKYQGKSVRHSCMGLCWPYAIVHWI